MKRLLAGTWLMLACTHPDAAPADAAVLPTPSASVSAVATSSATPVASASALPCSTLTDVPPAAQPVDGSMWGEPTGGTVPGRNGVVGAAGHRPSEVIGIGQVSSSGHGAGAATPPGHGQLGGGHETKTPRVREGNVTVSGGLPSEVVERVTRQTFGRFRLCYETGRQKDPTLHGAVVARFTVGATGTVSKAESDPCTTMPDPDVTSCVLRSVSALKFPVSDAREAQVVFPILFSPE
jgi:hypothetical protein